MEEGLKISLVLTTVIFLSHVCWTWGEKNYLNYYTSRTNELCNNDCRMRGRDYYWCDTRNGWDYCSGWENTDYKGNECRDDHPCDKHGRDYYWCRKKVGEKKTDKKTDDWDYCGKVEAKKEVYMTSTYQSVCNDACVYQSNFWGSYYWCHTDDGWDYCSPNADYTYRNVPCRSNHPCHTYGESYTWCKTDSGWNYCGLVIKTDWEENTDRIMN